MTLRLTKFGTLYIQINGTSGPNKINTQEKGSSHEQKNEVQKKKKTI